MPGQAAVLALPGTRARLLSCSGLKTQALVSFGLFNPCTQMLAEEPPKSGPAAQPCVCAVLGEVVAALCQIRDGAGRRTLSDVGSEVRQLWSLKGSLPLCSPGYTEKHSH